MKASGKTRHTKQFAEDMKTYYEKIGIANIASVYQVQRVLLGNIFDFSTVCQIAFFLGMSVKELTVAELSQEQIERERNSHCVKDKAPIDWKAHDEETAPLLEQLAKNIYDGTASKAGRPERVSEKIIYRKLELPGHRLELLPKCKAIFDRYTEPYEENWARRISWAYEKLKAEGKPFFWSDIRSLAGVKKENVEKAIPYLKKQANKETYNAIMCLFIL